MKSQGGKNILHTTKGRKANCMSHLSRKCLVKHVIGGKPEGHKDEKEDITSYWVTLKKMRR